jgi:hypothetical protein
MIKKNIILLSILFFFNSCGFTPLYMANKNVNFSIEQANYIGDRELNNFLKVNLNKYKNEKSDNKILVEINSEYNKIILSNNAAGEVTNYQLEANVVILIKNTNKVIKIYENSIMKNMSDKFEEERYERSIKQNFASSITNKLISELIIN